MVWFNFISVKNTLKVKFICNAKKIKPLDGASVHLVKSKMLTKKPTSSTICNIFIDYSVNIFQVDLKLDYL